MDLDIFTLGRYILSNIVINLVMLWFLGRVYSKKYDNKWIYLLLYVVLVSVRTVIACIGIPPLNVITSLLCINLMSILFYQCRLKECILYNFLFMLVELFADIVGTSLVSVVVGNTIAEVFGNHAFNYIGSLFYCILQILFSRLLTYFLTKTDRSPVQTKEIVFLIVMTFLEIVIIMYAINNFLTQKSGEYLILLSCVFLFINIYVVYLIEQTTRLVKLEQDLSWSKRQSLLQLSHYKRLKEKQEIYRKTIHDVQKHLLTIEGLYDSGGIDEARRYGVSLKEEFKKLNGGFTHQNKILEAIISSKQEQVSLNNITFITEIQDFNIDFMDDLDITVIFANLLDNAFEACLELEPNKRIIELHIYIHKNFIVINISNPIGEGIKKVGTAFKTTKKGHRGIGLSNVSDIVRKYEGNFVTDVDTDKFTVKVFIPIK